MSVSIYYQARRSKPLTRSESLLVKMIVQFFSVDSRIKKYLETGEGLNWESFCLYEKPTAPDLVIEGATKLPDNTKDADVHGAEYWCAVLSFLRLAISDAEWTVTIEDHPIKWDETNRKYDQRT